MIGNSIIFNLFVEAERGGGKGKTDRKRRDRQGTYQIIHRIAPTDPKCANSSTGSTSRHRIIRFNNESIGAAFGHAPQGRGAPLWMLSWSSLRILGLKGCIPCLFGLILWLIPILPYLCPPHPTPSPSAPPPPWPADRGPLCTCTGQADQGLARLIGACAYFPSAHPSTLC